MLTPLALEADPADAQRRPTGPTESTSRTVVDRTAPDQRSPNPLAGRPWGVYQGDAELAWPPYEQADGDNKELLAKIALEPKAKWFGDWVSDAQIGAKVDDYIAKSTGGDSETLVSMTIFRLHPWENEACTRLPSAAEKSSYKTWIRRFASAVGAQHTALILQPDGPFALCAPGGSRILSNLVGFATRTFAALPNTAVYLDAGSADWHRMDTAPAVKLLLRAGVDMARGFTLDTTHYDSTEHQIRYGAKVVEALAARGVGDAHFVVDTADNGRPFTGAYYKAHPSGGKLDNAAPCRTKHQSHCVALGIPPTADVDNPRWGLSPVATTLARKYVDGYVWAGRPWLTSQTFPFNLDRALAVARTSPY